MYLHTFHWNIQSGSDSWTRRHIVSLEGPVWMNGGPSLLHWKIQSGSDSWTWIWLTPSKHADANLLRLAGNSL